MPKSSTSHPKTGKRRVHASASNTTSGPRNQTTSIQDQSAIQSQQQSYTTIQRDWPQAHFAWSLANDVSKIPARKPAEINTAAGRDLTPLERWQIETSRQSSWNNVGSVATENTYQDNGQNISGRGIDGTDDGSWWPCGSGAGNKEA